jgi:hypothetical protein
MSICVMKDLKLKLRDLHASGSKCTFAKMVFFFFRLRVNALPLRILLHGADSITPARHRFV